MTENIEVFEQNSIRIRCGAGAVYIDPFRLRERPGDADFILITHDHYDHFSPEDIAKAAGPKTVLVVPETMKDKAREAARYVSGIVTVKPGEHREIEGLELETVASYNVGKQFHPKSAGWVGYILNADGKRIYVAGDTDATPEARSVRCDVALLPIGGTYTMDAGEAAALANEIRPAVAIPVHYGTVVGSPRDADSFAAKVKEPVRVEKKIR